MQQFIAIKLPLFLLREGDLVEYPDGSQRIITSAVVVKNDNAEFTHRHPLGTVEYNISYDAQCEVTVFEAAGVAAS